MTRRKTELMEWMDSLLAGDPAFARAVEERMVEMRLEQDVFALRERALAACESRTARAALSLRALRRAGNASKADNTPHDVRDERQPMEVRRRLFLELSSRLAKRLEALGVTEAEVLRDFEEFKRRRRERRNRVRSGPGS